MLRRQGRAVGADDERWRIGGESGQHALAEIAAILRAQAERAELLAGSKCRVRAIRRAPQINRAKPGGERSLHRAQEKALMQIGSTLGTQRGD